MPAAWLPPGWRTTTPAHSALGYQTPAAYAAQLAAMGDQLRAPETLRRSPIAPSARAQLLPAGSGFNWMNGGAQHHHDPCAGDVARCLQCGHRSDPFRDRYDLHTFGWLHYSSTGRKPFHRFRNIRARLRNNCPQGRPIHDRPDSSDHRHSRISSNCAMVASCHGVLTSWRQTPGSRGLLDSSNLCGPIFRFRQ